MSCLSTMQAAFIQKNGGPEVIEVGEVPHPKISPSEVLVELKAAALNHLDIWVRKGIPGLKSSFPLVLGADGAGVIAERGSEVAHVKEGDEVVIHPGISCLHCEKCLSGRETLCPGYQILGEHLNGTHAQWVKVPAANVFPKPQHLSFQDAGAGGLVNITAWHMLVRQARVAPGNLVLIHGAGSGVTIAAIQIAALFGAEVIVTSRHQSKLELAKKMGAKHTVHVRGGKFGEEVRRISKLGVDVIIDHVGRDYWEENLRLVRWGGKIVTCGATSGWEATTDLRQVFFRQLEVLGSTMGSKSDFPEILVLWGEAKLRVVVNKVYPLQQIREAHRYLEAGEQTGKVAIHF